MEQEIDHDRRTTLCVSNSGGATRRLRQRQGRQELTNSRVRKDSCNHEAKVVTLLLGHDILVLIYRQESHNQDGQSKSSDHVHHLSHHLAQAIQPISGRNELNRNSQVEQHLFRARVMPTKSLSKNSDTQAILLSRNKCATSTRQ